MGKIRFTKPICVVDCNFIQAFRGDEDDVPKEWDCLLISCILGELATKGDKEKEFLLNRFVLWLHRNAQRVWHARDWERLFRAHEWTYRRVRLIRLTDFVSQKETAELRTFAGNTNLDWRDVLSHPLTTEWLKQLGTARSNFVSFTDQCRELVETLPGSPSEKIPHTPAAIKDYVQRYDVASLIVHSEGKGRYGDKRWRRHLGKFPDKLLIARRARLDLYYAIRRALGDSKKFENNWDDIHYAIAASYTGHIATHDAGLIAACQILAPGVRVFPKRV